MREAKRRLSNDPVLHRIIDSSKAAGKKDKDLIEYLGMVRGTATAWKYRNIKSYLTRINGYCGVFECITELSATGN